MRLPICGCGRVMNCSNTGLNVLTHSEDGLEYQLWASDEYTCPSCGAKAVIINSQAPIAEHWQPGFDRAKRNGESPDGRRRLFRAYYGGRNLKDDNGDPTNIAGVELIPILVRDRMRQSHLNTAALSSVDSTTPEADDAQHHDNTTEPEAR